jgi:glycosyltransferase involved in cell wall biosynthesis
MPSTLAGGLAAASHPRRVLVTADPVLPVPPRLYGGIERVIALLVDGLSRRGHEVTLIAHPESTVACELVPYPGTSGRANGETVRHAALIAAEVRRRRPHLVQSFSRLAYLAAILPRDVPKVMSYQRPVTRRTVTWAYQLSRGTLSFTGCSRQLIGSVSDVGRWRVIYNGVPLNTYTATTAVAPDAPLVFLGRIEHIKGTHLAIDVARRAGRRLIIAGNVPSDGLHEMYFRERIVPHLDGRHVEYVGPVDDAQKADLLGRAAALLMPVLWDEPFGIVMAEALACGTPVIGLARGAVPEVVTPGVTGFVCATPDQMVQAVRDLPQTSRSACRDAAEQRFSDRALVDAYEALFDDVLTPSSVRTATPAPQGRPLVR